MKVRAEEFIRRFLQHVLPSGFQKVRHYGFMHKRSKVSVIWLAMRVTTTLNMMQQLDITVPELKQKRTLLCPDAINSICRGSS